MKMYVVCHRMLSPIQKGIQAQHAITEMLVQNRHGQIFHDNYFEWAEQHKTDVFLQGGGHGHLLSLNDKFNELKEIGIDTYNTLFFEDEDSLNNSATALAFIADSKLLNIFDEYWRAPPSDRQTLLHVTMDLPQTCVELVQEIVTMPLVPA